jgi:hypothetical protein
LHLVYFVYPETAGVRLEDMDALFGDATSLMPTPASRAETGSLIGTGSPIPSMDLRPGVVGAGSSSGIGASSTIPGFDIDPPHVHIINGKPQFTTAEDSSSEGVGGWISRMVNRSRGETGSQRSGGSGSGRSGQYKALDQGDDDEQV